MVIFTGTLLTLLQSKLSLNIPLDNTISYVTMVHLLRIKTQHSISDNGQYAVKNLMNVIILRQLVL